MKPAVEQPWRFRELLTIKQVADYLHKSSEAARKWARRHPELPMSKVGREWRIDKRDLDRAIEQDTKKALKAS